MDCLSWILSPSAAHFWDVMADVVGWVVAVSVFGESISHLIPAYWLPSFINRPGQIEAIAKWSTWALIFALFIEVPIGRARAVISELELSKLHTDLISTQKEATRLKGPRNLSEQFQSDLSSKLKPLGPKHFTFGVLIGGLEPGSKLLEQLMASLVLAGWQIVSNKNVEMARGQPAPNNGISPIIGIVGVKVFYNKTQAAEFRDVSNLISDELNAAGIITEAIELPATDEMDPSAIHISIGAKT